MSDSPSPEDLFHAARRLAEGADREAYLRDACGADGALRARIEALLRADAEASAVFWESDRGDERDERRGNGDAAAAAVDEMAGELDRYRQRREPGARASPRSESVLAALEARIGSALGVHLDSPGPEGEPVRVTAEARRLRDPSGRYQVLGEIGRGGVGVVYKGRDQDLGRDVAMKVLKDDYAERPDVLARFVEEAQIGGQLQHPGIVPVYELGLQAGERPYFAMKLVKGETLAAQLAQRTDPAEDRRRLLGVFEQVCQTLAYAHSRRVIHRDLKPSNVMIGAFGEVQVVDWGFSKVLTRGEQADEHAALEAASEVSVIETVRSGSGSSHSRPGSMMGTPAYMPPEQAQGDHEQLDERSDVFGLGAILCELLTGAPPYRKEEGDLVRQAANAELEPARERLAQCGADEALVTLCLECLAPARVARPASAQELAERVAAHLSSVEERAREAELRAMQARHKQRMTLVAASAALLILALGGGSWAWLERERQTRRADAERRVAAAMSAANGMYARAQVAALDTSLWESARDLVGQLELLTGEKAVRAQTAAEARALIGEVRARAGVALRTARQRAADSAMLERLALVRESAELPIPEDYSWNYSEAGAEAHARRRLQLLDEGYSDAFRSYLGGELLAELSVEDAHAELSRGEIAMELATSLDHWAMVLDDLGLDSGRGTQTRELAMRLDPENPTRARLRARLRTASESGPELLGLVGLEALSELGPAGCLVLVEALRRIGEDDAVLDVLRSATELYPLDYELCRRLIRTLEERGEWREAYAASRVAIAIRPDEPGAPTTAAAILEAMGRPRDAERTFRLALTRFPESATLWNNLGVLLWTEDRNDEALEAYRRAVELDPDRVQFVNHLAALQIHHSGELEEAIELLLCTLEKDPEHGGLIGNLGDAYSFQGDSDKALEHWEQAGRLLPSRGWPLCNAAWHLADQGRLDESMALTREVLRREPDHMTAVKVLTLLVESRPELRDEALALWTKAEQALVSKRELYLRDGGGAGIKFERLERDLAEVRDLLEE